MKFWLLGLISLFLVSGCYSLRADDATTVEPIYKQTWAPALPLGDLRLGWFKKTPMTEAELNLILKQKAAELELNYQKKLQEAELEKQKARLEAENKMRLLCWIGAAIGGLMLIAGIVLAIYFKDAGGINLAVAGTFVAAACGSMVMYTQLIPWVGIPLIGLIVIYGIYLAVQAIKNKKLAEVAVQTVDVAKKYQTWDDKAKEEVRKIQGADPASHDRTWIEKSFDAMREKLRAKAPKTTVAPKPA